MRRLLPLLVIAGIVFTAGDMPSTRIEMGVGYRWRHLESRSQGTTQMVRFPASAASGIATSYERSARWVIVRYQGGNVAGVHKAAVYSSVFPAGVDTVAFGGNAKEMVIGGMGLIDSVNIIVDATFPVTYEMMATD